MTPAEIKRRRAALGLSQAKLGALLGVTENTVYRWEHGDVVTDNPAMLDLALKHLEATMQTDSALLRAAAMLRTLYTDLLERRDPESGLAGRAYKAVSHPDDPGFGRALTLAERSATPVGRAVATILRAAVGDATFEEAARAMQDVYRTAAE